MEKVKGKWNIIDLRDDELHKAVGALLDGLTKLPDNMDSGKVIAAAIVVVAMMANSLGIPKEYIDSCVQQVRESFLEMQGKTEEQKQLALGLLLDENTTPRA